MHRAYRAIRLTGLACHLIAHLQGSHLQIPGTVTAIAIVAVTATRERPRPQP